MILLVTGYELKSYREHPAQILAVAPCCPGCGRLLHRHGSYWRWVYLGGNEAYRLPIFRFRCRRCRLTVSLLPDFLIPYFRYAAAVISAALVAYALTAASLRQIAATLHEGIAHGGDDLQEGLPNLATIQSWFRRFRAWVSTYLTALVRWVLRLLPTSPALWLLAEPPGEVPPAAPARRQGAALIRVACGLALGGQAWLSWLNRFVLGVLGQLPWHRPPPNLR